MLLPNLAYARHSITPVVKAKGRYNVIATSGSVCWRGSFFFTLNASILSSTLRLYAPPYLTNRVWHVAVLRHFQEANLFLCVRYTTETRYFKFSRYLNIATLTKHDYSAYFKLRFNFSWKRLTGTIEGNIFTSYK